MVDLADTSTILIGFLALTIVVLSVSAIRRKEQISRLQDKNLRDKELEVAFQRKALFESGLVSVTDEEGRIIEVNSKFLGAFGYRKDDIIGKHVSELYPEEEQKLSREIRSKTRGGSIWTGEAHLLRADGSQALTYNTVVPFMDGNNKHIKNLSFRVDISRQKMRDNQKLVTTAFDSMSDAVVLYDPDSYQVCYMNTFALAEHGWHMDEIGEKTVWDMIYVPDPAVVTEKCKKIAETGKCSARLENEANGKVYDAHSYRVAVAADTYRILTVFREVSQSVELERERQRLISIITHELRTPLTSIKGALGLLDSCAMGPMPSEAKNLVGIGLRNSDRMLELIAQILESEKAEHEARNEPLEPINIGETVRAAIAANQGYGAELGITFQEPVESPDLWANASERMLDQILANLMSNAAKFSPEGSTVDVWAERRGEHVVINVRDHGTGIPKDLQPQLFSRFIKADQQVRGNVHGSGLGLSIVKSQVEHLDGTIDFETAENVGTCFRIALPLLEDDQHLVEPYQVSA